MQAERFYHRPVIPLTVAWMAGIALGSAAPGLEVWALVVAGGCGWGIIRCLLRRSPAAVSPLMLFCALGYLSLQSFHTDRGTSLGSTEESILSFRRAMSLGPQTAEKSLSRRL